MAVTPLCDNLSQLYLSSKPRDRTRRRYPAPSRRARYNSPQLFSSALKPLCSDVSQTQFRYLRAIPAQTKADIKCLKVRPFKLRPKNPPTGPLDFPDIKQGTVSGHISSYKQHQALCRDLIDPHFLKALAKHQAKKVLRLRKHPRLHKLFVWIPRQIRDNIHKPKPGWKAPRPSTPFNDDTDLDPFMLFPELQWPYSPLKDDSIKYKEEAKQAEEAKELRYRARRGSMTSDDLKEMIHITYGLGKFGTPAPLSISCEAGSPMDIDE